MISAESDMVINHYINMGCKKFLSKRPKSFDSPDSEQKHEFGIKMNSFSKPRALGVMQTFVEYNAQYCVFEQIINDFLAYDDQNIGNDYDGADAVGNALARIYDMKRLPTDEQVTKAVESLALPHYEEKNGVLVQTNKYATEPEKGDKVMNEYEMFTSILNSQIKKKD